MTDANLLRFRLLPTAPNGPTPYVVLDPAAVVAVHETNYPAEGGGVDIVAVVHLAGGATFEAVDDFPRTVARDIWAAKAKR